MGVCGVGEAVPFWRRRFVLFWLCSFTQQVLPKLQSGALTPIHDKQSFSLADAQASPPPPPPPPPACGIALRGLWPVGALLPRVPWFDRPPPRCCQPWHSSYSDGCTLVPQVLTLVQEHFAKTILALACVPQASHNYMESNANIGKVVLHVVRE